MRKIQSKVDRLQYKTNYKNNIIKKLISRQELCKALFYNQANFLSLPNIDPYILLENDTRRIYSYEYVPTSTDEKKIYITMELRNYGLVRNRYKNGYAYIYTLVHQDCEETDMGSLRTDYLLSLIDQQLNQMIGVGVGRLQFHDSDKVHVNDSYNGHCNVYKFYEFN